MEMDESMTIEAVIARWRDEGVYLRKDLCVRDLAALKVLPVIEWLEAISCWTVPHATAFENDSADAEMARRCAAIGLTIVSEGEKCMVCITPFARTLLGAVDFAGSLLTILCADAE